MFCVSRNSEYEQIEDQTYQILKDLSQNDIQYKVYAYKDDKTKLLYFRIFSILFLGLPHVFLMWYPKFKVIKYSRCQLNGANILFVTDSHNNDALVEVRVRTIVIPQVGPTQLRYFSYQHSKYVFIHHKGLFGPLHELFPTSTLDDILENSNGLTQSEHQELYKIYGPNKIEVEVKSYWKLFVEEVFTPFYIFQGFSVILWCVDDYIIYAACVLLLTLFSVITALVQTRKQSVALHNLVESSNSSSVQILSPKILAGHYVITVASTDLVPGDLLIIPASGCVMPCDAALLTGHCIVNESMLTGESVPVTKTPPPASSEIYNVNTHKRHTLFAGTHVIQTRYYGDQYVLAKVVQTGFDTTKGSLVKSILFPKPIGLKFYEDSLKFVFVLFMIATMGMTYCLFLYIRRGADIKAIVIRTLDIITIVVPPALPAAMTVGIVYSQNRLKKLGIFCISPPRINICGKIKLACFDKTGTLTHEGLEMYLVVPCDSANFTPPIADLRCLDNKSYLKMAMATCHSLTRIDGELSGDPLDLNMFECLDWELEEPGIEENTRFDMLGPTVVKPKKSEQTENAGGDVEIQYEIGIVKQFPFSSNLQSMSVICRVLGASTMTAFTKGAPERLKNMCCAETLPYDFNSRLAEFTAQGFRVIAVAYKELPSNFKWKDAQKIKRNFIECDLTFLGFIVMQNTLKSETTPVIAALHNANIRTVMITGDNIMTAISVARKCGMVAVDDHVVVLQTEVTENEDAIPKILVENSDGSTVLNFDQKSYHFAIDGNTWLKLKHYYPELIPKILIKTTIFARFQPDQKTQLIMNFQELDYIVSMVGDGANDCGALKAAHVGVSLSQAEASVAAPFTSSIPNISCILFLMLEGRCALVTSFAVFKFMALYSLIQFFTILILYSCHSMLGNMQFLFIDLIITTTLAVTIGRQGPASRLGKKRPLGSLVAPVNLIPLALQITFCGLLQVVALYYLDMQPWFDPLPPGKEEVIICWENTVLFCVSCFQYIVLACIYSKGKPYREMLITNGWLLTTSLILICFVTWLLVLPVKEIAEFFEVLYLPERHDSVQHVFRYKLMQFPLVHLCAAVVIEIAVADSLWLKKFVHFVIRKKQPKNKYKLLQKYSFEESLSCSDSVRIVVS